MFIKSLILFGFINESPAATGFPQNGPAKCGAKRNECSRDVYLNLFVFNFVNNLRIQKSRSISKIAEISFCDFS